MQIQTVDNVDDRREIHRLLCALSPSRRIAFLAWCCQHATLPKSAIKPFVAPKTRRLAEEARWDSGADDRLTLEITQDLYHLAIQYRFDLSRALVKLEAMA